MAKHLNREQLRNLIKEAVTRKLQTLRESIDVDDEDVWDNYDDEAYNNWVSDNGKMPNGYDEDITDGATLDRIGMLNHNGNGADFTSPVLKKAQEKASWNALEKDRTYNTDKLNQSYDDNYYNDFNLNSYEDSSNGSGITDAPGVSAESDEMWAANESRNIPNEDTRYYEYQETDPLDGEELNLSDEVVEEVKRRVIERIKNDKLLSKKLMKEEVDMGQVSAASEKHSTATIYSPEVRKQIRKLRSMIDQYEQEGKDTSALTKKIQDLKKSVEK